LAPHDLSGSVALITGCGSGMGGRIAARFAEAGAAVMLHYHTNAAGAETLAGQIRERGGRAATYAADVTSPDSVTKLVQSTVETLGRLDILINNAGIYPLAGVLEMSIEAWDSVLDADLKSIFLCTQAAARQMLARCAGAPS
jgi:NAD(P)-dependent dehydrogenase (short-subunit alcohol dehydrogenase family)